MRAFICFDPSDEVKEALKHLQKEFHDSGNINFVNEFHCTLKFLGDIDESTLDIVKKLLSDIKFDEFEVSLDHLGVFPNENYVRVLWVGLNGDVLDLKNKIDNSLDGLFDKDEYEFKSHITLGRVKFLENKHKFREKLNIKLQGKFKVKEFKLMKSELTREGPVYEVLKTYKAE